MTRQINDAGLTLLKKREGLRLEAYQDDAGYWTIGYGHRHGVKQGHKLKSAHEAEVILRSDLASVEDVVNDYAPVFSSSNEFSAAVVFCFNIGTTEFVTSTMLREWRARRTDKAAKAFELFNKITDPKTHKLVPSSGLLKRRKLEAALFLRPDNA